ncbi:MAG: hypothetical protein KDK36_03990, partial [Leptospiraceae bacterium]|nr:hypothetical protein [Leptospiraceae bacterium]
ILFITTSFLISIKESSLPIVGILTLISFIQGKKEHWLIFLTNIILYFLLKFIIEYKMNYLLGTNPMGFFDLIDYPLFGFIKSFTFASFAKEITKLILFSYYISLILQYKNFKNFIQLLHSIPIAFFLTVIVFAEVGYWLSFDNISRFFTICLPYVILISNFKKNYRFYGMKELSVILFLLFILRTIRHKEIMDYFLSN